MWTRHIARTGLAIALTAGSLATSSQATVIAHWSFDEIVNDNQFADSTGTNHATIAAVGGPPGISVDNADKVFGAGAANFNRGPMPDQANGDAGNGAPGAYATAPHLEGIYTGSHTVAAWVKVTADTSWSGVLGDWANEPYETGRAYLYGFTGGTDNSAGAEKPMLTVQNAAGNNGPINFGTNNAGTFTKDEWHHVAWVVDRIDMGTSELSIFVDGEFFHGGTWTPASGNADIRNNLGNPTWIGLKEDNGLDFHGKLDELWVIGRALNPDEIGILMETNVVVPEPSTWALALLGCTLGAVMLRRRRR